MIDANSVSPGDEGVRMFTTKDRRLEAGAL